MGLTHFFLIVAFVFSALGIGLDVRNRRVLKKLKAEIERLKGFQSLSVADGWKQLPSVDQHQTKRYYKRVSESLEVWGVEDLSHIPPSQLTDDQLAHLIEREAMSDSQRRIFDTIEQAHRAALQRRNSARN